MSDTPETDKACRSDNFGPEIVNLSKAFERTISDLRVIQETHKKEILRHIEEKYAIAKDRDSWKAKAEANERDAGYYRWIRDEHPVCNLWMKDRCDKTLWIFGTPMLDSAIDAARSAEKEKE